MQALLQTKIDAYLEHKYRVSKSHATRDSCRIIVNRFVDFIQIQYRRDFEQFLQALGKPKTDPIEILDENFSQIQKENLDLRGIVDNLSSQLQSLEKRIEF